MSGSREPSQNSLKYSVLTHHQISLLNYQYVAELSRDVVVTNRRIFPESKRTMIKIVQALNDDSVLQRKSQLQEAV